VLGEGGSATVYDARWGHRSIALKVLRAELGDADRRRFLDESRLLIEMAHPGVVKALSAGTLPDGRTYLAMEKLPGVTLAERLGVGPIDLATSVRLFDQLADAVAAMHAVGLLHRDLKPENVMLVASEGDDTAHAVLLDFGIAKAMVDGVATLTTTGQVRGTPAYMAPERFFGSPATITTDVYELAVTFFAMVAGRLPWDDDADPDVRLNPMRLRDVADVPGPLDECIARALSTRAANRPENIAGLREAIHRASGVGNGPPQRVTAPVPLPLAPTQQAPAAAPGQPWRRSGGAVTTGSAASGERMGGATQDVAVPRRKRWPLVVATVALAGGASTAAVVVLGRGGGGGGSPVATTPRAPDPWADNASPVAAGEPMERSPTPPALARLELTAELRDALREQAAAALLHHAPDATAIATISLAELRANDALGPVLTRAHGSALFDQLTSLFVGTCELDLAGRGNWVSLGVLHGNGKTVAQYDLIASGSWTRTELETCFMTGRNGTLARRNVKGGQGDAISAVPTGLAEHPDLILWLDEHTFYASTRPGDAAFLAERAALRTNPSPLDRIGSRIDRHATGWIVARREAMASAVEDVALRADFAARLELGDDGLAAAAALYQTDDAAAEKTRVALAKQLAAVTDSPLLRLAIPELAVERDGTTVRLRARLPSGLLEKLREQLIEAMP